MTTNLTTPTAEEYAPYYQGYVQLATARKDIPAALHQQLMRSVPRSENFQTNRPASVLDLRNGPSRK